MLEFTLIYILSALIIYGTTRLATYLDVPDLAVRKSSDAFIILVICIVPFVNAIIAVVILFKFSKELLKKLWKKYAVIPDINWMEVFFFHRKGDL